jgi:glycosyltransferase involved in cell wall biosynthesis
MDDSPRIDLAVAGKFHAFSLASEFAALHRLGELYCVHRTTAPPKNVPRSAYKNRLDIAAWAAASRFVPLGFTAERKFEIFDNWTAKKLARKTPGILHSWNGSSLNTYKRLKGSGWLLCNERSCPHNQFQYDLLLEEGKALGVPHRQDMRGLERAIEELHLADIIVAPSTYSASSYTEPDLIRKVRVNPLGGNVKYLERSTRAPGLIVLTVGNSFLRKGIHYLVEAFKLIDDPGAELWIRGEVPEAYRKRIEDPRVKIIPPVLPERLRELYETADVFVQSSIDEGFGMAVFEALGYGLPLVITEHVGAKDLLNADVAVTVPIRDAKAIASAIERALRLPGPAFDKVRKSILERNSWRACAQRMIDNVYVR